jgi:tetratricopeptide (TPR) repeat protein
MAAVLQPAAQPQVQQVTVEQAVALAVEHFQAGRRAEAEAVCLQILEQQPEQPDALHVAGSLAHLERKNGYALALLEKSVRLNSSNPQSQYNLGVVYGALQKMDQAAERYRAAITLDPNHVSALMNLGNIAMEREVFEEARSCYETAVRVQPDNANLHLAMALMFFAQRRVDEARPYFQRALDLDPNSHRIRWEASHWCLLKGDFVNGWTLYESRFPSGHECKVWHYPYPYPLWRGEPLAGKNVLVHGEQGLGDEIMFFSIVPELLAEGAIVTLVGQPHMTQLWKDSFPQCRVYPQLRANQDAWTREPLPWMG